MRCVEKYPEELEFLWAFGSEPEFDDDLKTFHYKFHSKYGLTAEVKFGAISADCHVRLAHNDSTIAQFYSEFTKTIKIDAASSAILIVFDVNGIGEHLRLVVGDELALTWSSLSI